MDDDTFALAAGAAEDVFLSPPPPEPPLGPCLTLGVRVFPLRTGENLVGRSEGAAVHLDSAAVSRRHAVVHVGTDAATLEDLHSLNGTVVRDERISTPVALHDGDAVRVGTIWLVYRSPAREGPGDA
jgi:pSer/pThr/pTyr-binding forkhead associated (FHA) protein